MKNRAVLLIVVGVALLLAGIVGVRLLMQLGPRASLRGLGRGEAAYQRVRQDLLYNTTDPLPLLVAYAADEHNTPLGRARALRLIAELSRQQDVSCADSIAILLLNSKSRDLQIEALGVISQLASARAIDGVSAVFMRASDTLLYRRAFETLRTIGERLGQRIAEALSVHDSASVDTCVRAVERMAAGRGSIYLKMIAHCRAVGDTPGAELYRRKSGTLDRWWVCGQFENHSMRGFDKPYEPETKRFSPGDSFQTGGDTKAGWFPVERTEPDGKVVLNNLFVKECCSVGYLFTYVHSGSDHEALLLLGCGDGARAWLNDTLVMSAILYHEASIDGTFTRVHLHKGVNTLLCKVAQGAGAWDLLPRITRLDGDGFDDVQASLTQ